MVGSGDVRHAVTTKKQKVFLLSGKGTDKTLSNRVVDTVTTVFQVSEELRPKMLQVSTQIRALKCYLYLCWMLIANKDYIQILFFIDFITYTNK